MKKYRPGVRVRDLEELRTLRIVYVVPWKRAHPVAFFLSWQWRLIDQWVSYGNIFTAEEIENLDVKAKAKKWYDK
jgi:hypothetical protein